MKLESGFALENAPWPAFLVDESAVVHHANPAALDIFGATLEGKPALAASIWSPDVDLTPEQFLLKAAGRAVPVMPMKFQLKDGLAVFFDTSVCPLFYDGRKLFVFQLFRHSAPAAGEAAIVLDSEEMAQRKFESGDTALRTGAFSFEANAAQKQKLDCALQLARTVALDFNNALTSVLGHTSLVLSKLEPSNPARNSLMEVEKAAQKAAEI